MMENTTNTVQFSVNGRTVTVPTSTPVDLSLNEFLRTDLKLTGTKVMCREGGCGACVVSVRKPDLPANSISVNSCLTPVLSCRNWHITTIEGIGSTSAALNAKPLHIIQQQIAAHHGTQCGYCTPGFCMQQFALMNNGSKKSHRKHQSSSAEQCVEDAYDGNICRCTGYRPILDAMKSLKNDEDIENCTFPAAADQNNTQMLVFGNGSNGGGKAAAPKCAWFAPTSLEQLWQVIPNNVGGQRVRYVAGHTGEGVYRDGPYDAYVDLKLLPELNSGIKFSEKNLEIGSLTTLTQLIEFFEQDELKDGDYFYLPKIAEHIRRVANTAVRNVGTWAGNLMLKKHHRHFPSDLFVLFAAVGADVVVLTPQNGQCGKETTLSLEKFIMAPINNGCSEIIKSLILKPYSPKSTYFASFKVTPREVNAHAHCNAAMLLHIDPTNHTLLGDDKKPTLIFGNISGEFVHAQQTENALANANLLDWKNIVQRSCQTLRSEIKPNVEEDLANVSAKYRQSQCCALLYKGLLGAVKHFQVARIDKKLESAITRIERPVSSGKQAFGTDKTQWPVTQPIPKLEGLIQATGEAEFISDMAGAEKSTGTCLHAVPILAPKAPARLDSIDMSAAERVSGFVRVVLASDIPGENFVHGFNTALALGNVKLLVPLGDEIEYAGQPVGFVLAETEHAARACAEAVNVNATQTRKPILSCEDAIAAKAFFDVHEPDVKRGDANEAMKKAARTFKGSVKFGSQYHFHMETQVALCEPQDNGTLLLHAASQWPDLTQNGAARVTGLNSSDIDVDIRRVGGGFGAKGIYANTVSNMTAVGARLTNRACKMHLSLWDNTRMFFGGRHAYLFEYEVGVDSKHKLQAVKITAYCNTGFSPVDYIWAFQRSADNVYQCPNWLIHPIVCKTDTPLKTYTRAPGTTETCFIMEHIMERCAFELNIDPLEFRQLNFFSKSDTSLHQRSMKNFNIPEIVVKLVADAELQARKSAIANFNANNVWKKRALSVVPMLYPHGYGYFFYSAMVNIHHADGTVSVSVGAVDMGQGLNTKLAQCVARELNTPLEKVRVKLTTSTIAGNSFISAGSVPSELAVRAAVEACKKLNERMEVVRKELAGGKKKDDKWQDVVNKCYEKHIDLAERYWIDGKKYDGSANGKGAYEIYAAMATEVELDVLTGERQIRRVDLVYDCGESVSPAIDIGQAEGAIVMGLGLYTSEEEKRNTETGELLSFNTWNYKPPSAKDIPVDMRVSFLEGVPNKLGVFRSKAVGEPPLNAACSVVFALRQAVDEARRQFSTSNAKGGQQHSIPWIEMNAPATCEQVQQLCDVKDEYFSS